MLVKTTHHGKVCYPQPRIMPATKDCPLCGGTMRPRDVKSVVRLPGNPSATTRVSREWVCPDCDYFEEVEEES